MSLKPQPDRPAIAAPTPTSWGILAEPGEAVSSIRFECADGAYSYPYHTLARWVLQSMPPETLVIHANNDSITIHGRQLATIRDALDAGRIRVLRLPAERYAESKLGPVVTLLSVEPMKPTE
jgi:hypothetical protein